MSYISLITMIPSRFDDIRFNSLAFLQTCLYGKLRESKWGPKFLDNLRLELRKGEVLVYYPYVPASERMSRDFGAVRRFALRNQPQNVLLVLELKDGSVQVRRPIKA